MGATDVDGLYDLLEDIVGSALRGVVQYNGAEFEYRMRPDVRDAYTDAEIQEFVDDTIVHQLSTRDGEKAFKLGGIEGVVRVFERSWVVRVPVGQTSKQGCLISIERDRAVTMSAVEECLEVVADNASPP